jgi:hypothetical protein
MDSNLCRKHEPLSNNLTISTTHQSLSYPLSSNPILLFPCPLGHLQSPLRVFHHRRKHPASHHIINRINLSQIYSESCPLPSLSRSHLIVSNGHSHHRKP